VNRLGDLLCEQAKAAYPTDMMVEFDGPWLLRWLLRFCHLLLRLRSLSCRCMTLSFFSLPMPTAQQASASARTAPLHQS